jgi:GWxTD domain-containing protein
MNKLNISFCFILCCSLLLCFSFSCRLYNLEKKLDPVDAEFLSKVRYIITSEERKIFLELPDEEKEKFREEFWKRRDPDPNTEENEFRILYINRIEAADKLFRGEGRPGWLTDRGRIYILFGPPTDRITYPMGGDPYSRSREIWYYGSFPVVFVDFRSNGNYTLVTYDLSSVRSLNLMYMHELSLAQHEAQKTFKQEKGFFDFSWRVEKTFIEAERVEAIVIIEIPYAVIWFKAVDGRLKTTLDVHLDLRDFKNTVIWKYEEALELEIEEEELEKRQKENYNIEISFILEKNLEKIRRGKNQLHAVIKNRTGEEESEKVMEFKL